MLFYSTPFPKGKESAHTCQSGAIPSKPLLFKGINCTSLGFLNTSGFLVQLVLLHNMLARAALGKRVGRKLLSEADRREAVAQVPCLWTGADKVTHISESPALQRPHAHIT